MLSGLGVRPHERSPELAWLLNSEVKERFQLSALSFQQVLRPRALAALFVLYR
jgi:hypothetical protein